MKLETFFEKFDRFAIAPGAVRAFRESIFQWAIRGRLVSQNREESASKLLSSAIQSKILSKGLKKCFWFSKDVVPPFEIPPNWEWLCIGDAINMINGRAFKSSEWNDSGLPIIRIQNLNKESAHYNYFSGDYDAKHFITNGSFLISWSGTPGTSFGAFIWDRGDGLLNQHIFKCELYSEIVTKEYLRLAINSRLDEMISHAQGGVGLRHITKEKLEKIALPLPPLAEQKRIVAKVDALMALCDRLEAQEQERVTRHAALARASLARFADAPTTANLQFLFHKSYDIDPADLRKSILTLAVQGKLVHRDRDGRASDDFPIWNQVSIESVSGATPNHWLEIPFGETGEWTGGGTPSKSEPEYWNGNIPWVCPKDMKRPIVAESIDLITEEAVAGSSARYIPEGSILMVVRGMILIRAFPVALAGCKLTINQDMKAVTLVYPETKEYLHLALRALQQKFLDIVERSGHGTCKLRTRELHAMPIPLPPLSEQRRIVAKVDQLMALVDTLETQIAASRATAKNLLEALVAELTTAGTPTPKMRA